MLLQSLSQSDDRFDQELAEWFFRRGAAWSGTAAELLAAVQVKSGVDSSAWPQSSRAFYDQLRSHAQSLRWLGVEVVFHQGFPRIVSLRPRPKERPFGTPPSNYDDAVPAAGEASSENTPIAVAEVPEFCASDGLAQGVPVEAGIFLNTADALLAMVDMRRRVRDQNLDLEATVDMVISRAQELTRTCGVAFGLLLEEEIQLPVLARGAGSIKRPHFGAEIFQSSLKAGEAVQVRDAKSHPVLGAECRREGIGSLVMIPILRDQEVAGAMEFLFSENRSFSDGELMDLGLVAGVISESLSADIRFEVEEAKRDESSAEMAADPVGLWAAHSTDEQDGPAGDQSNLAKDSIDPEPPMESFTPELTVMGSMSSRWTAAPNLLWQAFRKAWTRHQRGL